MFPKRHSRLSDLSAPRKASPPPYVSLEALLSLRSNRDTFLGLLPAELFTLIHNYRKVAYQDPDLQYEVRLWSRYHLLAIACPNRGQPPPRARTHRGSNSK